MRLYTITGIQGFSDTYGCGAYSASTYNNGTCGASTTTPSSGNNNALTDTGIMVSLIVGLAALLLLIAILVRFWRRPAQAVTVPVEADDNVSDADETQNRQQ